MRSKIKRSAKIARRVEQTCGSGLRPLLTQARGENGSQYFPSVCGNLSLLLTDGCEISRRSLSPVYYFPAAVVTNYYTLSGLKPHAFIIL